MTTLLFLTACNASDVTSGPLPEGTQSTLSEIVTVKNDNALETFHFDVKKGMKWVYQRKTAVPEGGNVNFTTSDDVGDVTIEILDVTDNTVNVSYTLETKASGPIPAEKTTKTYLTSKPLFYTVYLRPATGMLLLEPGEGIEKANYEWSNPGQTEKVDVPAGSYDVKILTGKGEISLSTKSGNDMTMKVTEKYWMDPKVGLVKQELETETASSTMSAKGLTNIMELKSFNS